MSFESGREPTFDAFFLGVPFVVVLEIVEMEVAEE